MSHSHASCDFNELAHAASGKNLEHVRWRIDNHDIEELRATLSLKRQGGPHLSKQDCLVAYFVAVLNHNGRNPLQNVTNIASYRHLSTSFIIKDVASNLTMDVTTKVPTDMAGIAIALRNALVQCREPDYVYNWVMLASNVRLEAANAGGTFPQHPRTSHDKELTVNSHTKIDWCSAHFGCPGGTRFHMSGVTGFFLRTFKPNPAKGVDGVWRDRQSVEIWIAVPAALKPELLTTLSQGVRCMLSNQL